MRVCPTCGETRSNRAFGQRGRKTCNDCYRKAAMVKRAAEQQRKRRAAARFFRREHAPHKYRVIDIIDGTNRCLWHCATAKGCEREATWRHGAYRCCDVHKLPGCKPIKKRAPKQEPDASQVHAALARGLIAGRQLQSTAP